MSLNNPDFDELVEAAARLGYDDKQQVIDRLWRIIIRNQNYLDYRERRGRTSAYNQMVAEDSVALAAAIKLLKESQ